MEKRIRRREVEKGGDKRWKREADKRGGGKMQTTISINIHKYCQIFIYNIFIFYSLISVFRNLESNLNKVLILDFPIC